MSNRQALLGTQSQNFKCMNMLQSNITNEVDIGITGHFNTNSWTFFLSDSEHLFQVTCINMIKMLDPTQAGPTAQQTFTVQCCDPHPINKPCCYLQLFSNKKNADFPITRPGWKSFQVESPVLQLESVGDSCLLHHFHPFSERFPSSKLRDMEVHHS